MNNQNLDGADNTIGTQGVAPSLGEQTEASVLPTENQQTTTQPEGKTETLPESVSARTKEQFDKLIERNRSLSEELRKYKPVVPDGDVQSGGAIAPKKYVDSEGNVDVESLNKDLGQAVTFSKQAYELAQKQREEAEEKEAYAKHSWLNPSSPDYNKDAYEAVVDRVVRRRFIGNESVSLSEIASEVERFYKPNQTTPEQAVEQYKATEQQKNLTTPINAGKGQSRDAMDYEDLRRRTREGDSEATMERLRRVGIVK